MALECLDRACCGGWCTRWGPSDEMRRLFPPRHSDFRDTAPQQLERVYELYGPVVEQGRWTEGLCEMWWPKNKPVKHAVHLPCWDSFKWNPLKWRGIVFGRSARECFWSGTRQVRWARAVYAANLGREYIMPVRNIGRHGYKSDIKALFCMYCLMGCIFSCGVGQVFTMCGSSVCCNFAAWYSCHARERLRRRYKLPPSCGLPPGIDDCLVEFCCSYCSSHQMMRELVVRGVDGPGLHILDVLPNSFEGAPGIEEAKAERRRVLEGMLKRPPRMFRARTQRHIEQYHRGHRLELLMAQQAAALGGAMAEDEGDMPLALLDDHSEVGSDSSSPGATTPSGGSATARLGWCQYCPPEVQEMTRPSAAAAVGPAGVRHSRHATGLSAAGSAAQGGGGDGGAGVAVLERRSAPSEIRVLVEAPPLPEAELRKAWSVAY